MDMLLEWLMWYPSPFVCADNEAFPRVPDLQVILHWIKA